MTANLSIAPEPDPYRETRREWVVDQAESAIGGVASIFLAIGYRIDGGESRRVSITRAFDIGYEAGWRNGKRGNPRPEWLRE